jgi:hypothetical protein
VTHILEPSAKYAEVVFDLTWNLANTESEQHPDLDKFADSRERFMIVLSWALEFQNRHIDTDWGNLDYIETVDAFFDEKWAALQ